MEELQAEVHAFLNESGKTRFADSRMNLRVLLLFVAYLSVWASICFGNLSAAQALVLCVFLGVNGTAIALNVGHEASHSVFSKTRWVNDFLYQAGMSLLGVSGYLWKVGHLETHHRWVNVPGYEVGVDANDALRLTVDTPWKPRYRFQNWYAPALYSVYTVTWVLFRDWRVLASGQMAGHRFDRSARRFAGLFLIKAFYFTYMLAIPLYYSPFSTTQVLTGFLILHVFSSLYLASMLFTSHLSMEPGFALPDDEGNLPDSFATHHLRATMDILPESRLMNFLLGGFNSHAIHHLFPSVCSVYYPEMTAILKRKCREHGMPYLETSFGGAVVSHFRYLRRMGEPCST